MTKFKSQGFGNTFKNARKGFRLVVKSERNLRIHLAVASLVIAMGFIFQFTAIEFALDSIYHNKYSRMVGMAKDISAGAVMFATLISAIVGCIIFGKAAFDLYFASTL